MGHKPREGVSRRGVVGGLIASAAAPFVETVITPSAEAAETQRQFTYIPSSMRPETLQQDKENAAYYLVEKFWHDERARTRLMTTMFRGMRSRAEVERDLVRRSKMRIPDRSDYDRLVKNYPEQLSDLIANTPERECNFFEAGDEQTIYIVQNLGSGRIRFEKAYVMTTSKEDWSNIPETNGTSLGLLWVYRRRNGVLGEVISEKHKREMRGHFGPELEEDVDNRLLVRGLDYRGVHQNATVTTTGFVLWDPGLAKWGFWYGLMRGELVHGTNHEDGLGQRLSGGCTRMANVDVVDMGRYVRLPTLKPNGEIETFGSAVMIAAKGRKPVYPTEKPHFPQPKETPERRPREKEVPWTFDWKY